MFLKRVMSDSARMYTGIDCSKRLVLRRKMHVHQVWCELVEHNSIVSFQSEDQVVPFYDSQVARRCRHWDWGWSTYTIRRYINLSCSRLLAINRRLALLLSLCY